MWEKVFKLLKQVTLLKLVFNCLYKPLRSYYSKPQIYYINITNRVKYGPKAPKHAEIIWVKANEVDKIFSKGLFGDKGLLSKNMSGTVIYSDWPFSEALSLKGFLKSKYYKEKQWLNNFNPKHTKRIKREISLAFCIDHWVNGVSWQDTGAYDLLEKLIEFSGGPVDNCINRKDIVERYKNLDLIFEQVSKEGRLELPDNIRINYYRKGSSFGFIHIGPNCEAYYGGGANHRFAIAYILRVPFPAQIGLVHLSATPYLDYYRQQK